MKETTKDEQIEMLKGALKSALQTIGDDHVEAAVREVKARQKGVMWMFWWYTAINVTVSVVAAILQAL